MRITTQTRQTLVVFGVVLLAALTGCRDETPSRLLEPEADAAKASDSQTKPAGRRVADMYRALTDGQLESIIEEGDRRVFITFKEPGATEGVDRYGASLVSTATRDMAKASSRLGDSASNGRQVINRPL